MTPQEFLIDWIKERNPAKLAGKEIEIVGFEGRPSKSWSEYTEEDFSCTIMYRISGKRYRTYSDGSVAYDVEDLDENDVINFLQSFWKQGK